MQTSNKRIAIFVIAYRAVNTLDKVIDRIPKEVKDKVEEIFIFDDCSDDNTYYAALGYKSANKLRKLSVYKNESNLGYGGNQKKGYRYAISKGYDVVAMLHGDCQYDPSQLPKLLSPLENDEADMVFGSRMTGNPLRGGMPVYKFLGNKLLTFVSNLLLKTNLSEFHSGYRLYSCRALKQIPFERCSDNFHFDTDIIIMFKKKGLRIKELSIPTFYGDEISYVKVFRYGYNCLKSIIEYRLHEAGIRKSAKFSFN